MQSHKIVFRETVTVAIGVAICAALMVGVFAALGFFEIRVLWGAIAGSLLAVLNFFAMAFTTSLAADKAAGQDVKGGQALIQMSYIGRMILLLVILALCAKSGIFHLLALVLPLLFVRPVLTAAEFFKKKGENEA